MSQEQLAKAIGVTQSAIGQCERGEVKEMAPSNLLRAANILDVNPIWLISGSGAMLDRSPNTDDLAFQVDSLSEAERVVVKAVIEGLIAARKQ